MTVQHTIPNPSPITDDMTSNAVGTAPHDLVGRTIVTTFEIPDSDRAEILLRLDNDRVILLSCDPGYKDDYVERDPGRWDVCMYDATDTPAGRALLTLREGQWL